jgi:hypothetical protein
MPSQVSRVVPVRLNHETIAELAKQARKRKQPFGTYVRFLLQDLAPGRPAKRRGPGARAI